MISNQNPAMSVTANEIKLKLIASSVAGKSQLLIMGPVAILHMVKIPCRNDWL